MSVPPKRSNKVALALMGAAVGGVGLSSAFPGEDVQRNRYNSLTDCVADYSEKDCNRDAPIDPNTHSIGSSSYYGPWHHYYGYGFRGSRGATDPGPGRSGGMAGVSSFGSSSAGHAPAGVESGTRGGFGHTGHVSARGS